MKKVLLALLLVTALACKDDTKTKENNSEATKKEEAPKEVLTPVVVPTDVTTWGKVGAEIKETTETFSGQETYLLSRSKGESKSSYVHTRKIAVDYASDYRASVIVKKGKTGNLFGMRISGSYPDRVDAVFNLEDGTVKGVIKGRDFDNESANIEELGDGWYKCSVSAEVAADDVIIIFGPTGEENKVNGWEGKTKEISNNYILPSSLELHKVTFE